MLLVLVILSFLMFIIYNMVPSNRAYTDAKAEIQTMKKGMSAADMDTRFQELYLKYQRRYGTDTNNMVIRYLRWVGLYPLYDGSYSGLLQGNFGYSYEARDEVINVVKPRMGNTIFINIFVICCIQFLLFGFKFFLCTPKGLNINNFSCYLTYIIKSLNSFFFFTV